MPAERNEEIQKPDEPIDFITMLEVQADELDAFIEDWKRRSHIMEDADGFISDTLEKSQISNSAYQIVNISHWSSYNKWLDATNNPRYANQLAADHRTATHVKVTRGLYRPVAGTTRFYG